jgi:fumarylpyruvate hydrolase
MSALFTIAVPALPIADAASTFPVRRVFCVGRNYAAHAREMGRNPAREAPFFFMKPASAVVPVTGPEVTLRYPPKTRDYQHEIELVAAIGRRAMAVTPEEALDSVIGYAVGLDMTRRDLQLAARNAGRPWELGKSFAESAPIGPLRHVRDVGHPSKGSIRLDVNGMPRQRGDLADLIWSAAECISHLSAFDALEPGDLLFTGTPAGVAAVEPGDLLYGAVEGVGDVNVRIAAP